MRREDASRREVLRTDLSFCLSAPLACKRLTAGVRSRHTAGARARTCLSEMVLEAIQYKRGSLRLLDQRLLPLETKFVDVPGCDEAFAAIKDMLVRGAPAIAIAAGLALAVELANRASFPSGKEAAGVCPARRPSAAVPEVASFALQLMTIHE